MIANATNYLCILGSCSMFFAGSICQLISPNTIYKYLEKSYVLRGFIFPFKIYPTELEPLVSANDEDDGGDDDDGDRADKLV